MTNFLERFKGKTSLMGKEGLPGLLNKNDRPIDKPNFISIINESETSSNLKTRSLNNISLHDSNYKKSPQRNSYSISSQSNKPSHLIQAAKNSIGMSTFDFATEKNQSYTPNKETKGQYSASPFLTKSQKNRNYNFSSNLDLKKEKSKSSEVFKNNMNGYKYKKDNEVENIIKNKGIMVINEQNEEKEEDFEDLERKHLEFLTMIENMNLK